MELSVGTIETRFLAARVCGKWNRARAARSGASSSEGHKIDMYLYFLRHGEADWPNWKKSDDERPLTKRGKKEMHEVAKFLARIKARPALIVTSLLPPASQTAEIAAEHLKVNCPTYKPLAPAFLSNHLKPLFDKYPGKSLMASGHGP